MKRIYQVAMFYAWLGMSLFQFGFSSSNEPQSLIVQEQGQILVIALSGHVHYKLSSQQQPARLLLDIEQTADQLQVRPMQRHWALIKRLHWYYPDANHLRLVMALHTSLIKPIYQQGRVNTLKVMLSSVDGELSNLMQRAKHGERIAQNKLGLYYYRKQPVPQHYYLASYWFHRASKQGLPDAQYNLGSLYLKGLGVEQDVARAVTWFKQAAEQGQVKALYNLGLLYLKGLGVKRNPKIAVSLLRRAAIHRHAKAQYVLGILYEQGLGVPKNLSYSYAWMALAKWQGIKAPGALRAMIQS